MLIVGTGPKNPKANVAVGFKILYHTRMASLCRECRNLKANNRVKVKVYCYLHTYHPIIDTDLRNLYVIFGNFRSESWVSFVCRHTTRDDTVWPRSLRGMCAAGRLLGLRTRIPPKAWMSAYCECCVLSGRGLGDGPIPRPE